MSMKMRIFSSAVFALSLLAAPAATLPQANPVVVIETSLGDMTAELYADKAPKTVANFLAYVKSDFYRGTIFHRVIKTFMIQGGGFTSGMQRKQTRAPIPNEAANGLSNKRGTLAMARTADVNSATAQFFINTKDNQGLDHRGNSPDAFGYAVFGNLTDGLDVLDKIASVATTTKGSYRDVPVTDVVIKSVRLKK